MAVASKEDFKLACRKCSLERLIEMRDETIKFIHNYENDEIPEETYIINPNQDATYLSNHESLIILCELIIEKLS